MKKYFTLLIPIVLLISLFMATPANAQLIDWSHATVEFTDNMMIIRDLRFLGESFSACWALNTTNGNWILTGAILGVTGDPCGEVPGPEGTATVTVCVTNAVNGQPIPGASVSLDGFSGTTDSDGCIQFFDVPFGSYTAEASASGFVTSTTSVSVSQSEQEIAISLSPVQAEGEYRIILTWGRLPTDLDSHLLVPPGDSQPGYHIAFYDLGNQASYPYANLDIDDVTSYGPETVTIARPVQGIYRYYVHLWCCESDAPLTASNAVVTLFSGATQIGTWNVPTSGQGLYWHVFDLNAQTGQVVNVDTIVPVEPTAP